MSNIAEIRFGTAIFCFIIGITVTVCLCSFTTLPKLLFLLLIDFLSVLFSKGDLELIIQLCQFSLYQHLYCFLRETNQLASITFKTPVPFSLDQFLQHAYPQQQLFYFAFFIHFSPFFLIYERKMEPVLLYVIQQCSVPCSYFSFSHLTELNDVYSTNCYE